MTPLHLRRALSLLDVMFAEGPAVYVMARDLERYATSTLTTLSDALEFKWITERPAANGVHYTLTNLGRRERDAFLGRLKRTGLRDV